MAKEKKIDKVVIEKVVVEKVDKTQPGWSNTKPGSPQTIPVNTRRDIE